MMNSSIKKFSDLKFILFVVFLHFSFNFLTFIFLRYRIISLAPLFVYGILLFYGGFWLTKKKNRAVIFAFYCGVFSQLPAIFLSLIILIGILTGAYNLLTIFETFDFILQVWHTTLASLFPFLPPLRWLGTPLYYWFTVSFSFIYPLVIVLGAFLGQFSKKINIIKH